MAHYRLFVEYGSEQMVVSDRKCCLEGLANFPVKLLPCTVGMYRYLHSFLFSSEMLPMGFPHGRMKSTRSGHFVSIKGFPYSFGGIRLLNMKSSSFRGKE